MKGKAANERFPARNRDEIDIVVEESFGTAWPAAIPLDLAGRPYAPCSLFNLALRLLSRFKSQYEWVALFKQPGQELNEICELPEILFALNELFKSELSADLSVTQRSVLYEADCILIGRERLSKKIVAFGSSRFTKRGSLLKLGVTERVTNAGIFVVDSDHARAKLGIMMPSVIALYGHTLVSIFQREYTIVRINNKHLERVMLRGGRIYRYDKLNPDEISSAENQALKVMEWTHEHVFHLRNQPLEPGCGVRVTHRFPSSVTMAGLEQDEVTYVARVSSIVRFVFLVFWRAGRIPKQPAP